MNRYGWSFQFFTINYKAIWHICANLFVCSPWGFDTSHPSLFQVFVSSKLDKMHCKQSGSGYTPKTHFESRQVTVNTERDGSFFCSCLKKSPRPTRTWMTDQKQGQSWEPW